MEDFIQQFQEVAIANDWSGMATLLHIHTNLKDDVCRCGSHATLEEVLEALRSKYGLTIRKAVSRLSRLKRETKLSLTQHATEVKKLVDAANADLTRIHRHEITLDLFQQIEKETESELVQVAC